MPILNSYPLGTPRWWLNHLVQRLVDKQHRYNVLEDYHMGRHPDPKVDPKFLTAVRHFREMAKTNYMSLVNAAPVGRMRIRDFTFGNGGEPDEDAKRIWSVNDMELQSKKLHMSAAIFGDSYVLVGPPDPATGFPTMTVEDPRVAIVEPDPQYPTQSVAGLRMWEDRFLNRLVAVLYLPDGIYTYAGRLLREVYGTRKNELTQRGLIDTIGDSWEQIGSQDNPIGEVPLIHFQWQPDFNDLSLGEAELVLNIQDRVNQIILDRLIIAKNEAFNQKYVIGVKDTKTPANGKKGPARPPLEAGSSNLWLLDGVKTEMEVGQLPAVDFKQMLEAVRDDIADIASITQMPTHYLMGRMANVSGDTLTQAESGFVAKVKLRMEAMGWGWERAMRVAFKFMGDVSKATEPEATVQWANPMQRKDVDAADAASKWISSGVEIGVAMEQFGDYSSEQIAFVREHVEKMKAEAEAQLDKQLEAKAAQGGPASEKPDSKEPSGRGK